MLANIPTNLADSSSGIGALGLDGKALIIQVITFLLAFWVLQHWAFKPIVHLMEQRRQTIQEGVELGEQMKKDKAALEARIAEEMAKARADADGILADAGEQARQAIREAEEAAVKKADVILQEGKDKAASEMQRARKALESEVIGWVSDATEAIIGEKVDAKKDADLVASALKEQKA